MSDDREKYSIVRVPKEAAITLHGSDGEILPVKPLRLGWAYEGDNAFMLNMSGNGDHAKAARAAMRTYIRVLESRDPELCKSLEADVNEEDRKAQ